MGITTESSTYKFNLIIQNGSHMMHTADEGAFAPTYQAHSQFSIHDYLDLLRNIQYIYKFQITSTKLQSRIDHFEFQHSLVILLHFRFKMKISLEKILVDTSRAIADIAISEVERN